MNTLGLNDERTTKTADVTTRIKFLCIKNDGFMANTNRDTYYFISCGDKIFRFEGSPSMMKYYRFGGKSYAEGVDYKDLGFFDPSGGPFISEGFEIHGMKVNRIFVEEGKIFVEVY